MFLLGTFKGGEYRSERLSYNINHPRTARNVDGTVPHWSEPFEGKRISIVAFLHNRTADLDKRDKKYLASLGFVLERTSPLPPLACQPSDPVSGPGGKPRPLQSVSSASAPSESRPVYNRRIVEYCCGRNSLLGRPRLSADGCEVVRITADDDVTTPKGKRKVIDAIRNTSLPVLLWVSIPCTGGSPFLNISRKKGKANRKLLAKRVRDYRHIWQSFIESVDEEHCPGHIICNAWPAACVYWKRNEVARFMRRYNMRSVVFHGYMYGLSSRAKAHKGSPILKPWRVSFNFEDMLINFNRQCGVPPGSPCKYAGIPHVPCAGIDTQFTEEYREDIVNTIHVNFRHIVEVVRQKSSSEAIRCSAAVSRLPEERFGFLGKALVRPW